MLIINACILCNWKTCIGYSIISILNARLICTLLFFVFIIFIVYWLNLTEENVIDKIQIVLPN